MNCLITNDPCKVRSPKQPCLCDNCSEFMKENGIKVIWMVTLREDTWSFAQILYLCDSNQKAQSLIDSGEWKELAKSYNQYQRKQYGVEGDTFYVTLHAMELLS